MPRTQAPPHLTRHPDDCMGEITAKMQLENAVDRELFDRGRATESDIRSVEVEGIAGPPDPPAAMIRRRDHRRGGGASARGAVAETASSPSACNTRNDRQRDFRSLGPAVPMTPTVRQLVEALEMLPQDEQEARAASFLKALHRSRHDQARHEEQKDKNSAPYSSFKILRDAELPGPEDASATYEEKLYGAPHAEARES